MDGAFVDVLAIADEFKADRGVNLSTRQAARLSG